MTAAIVIAAGLIAFTYSSFFEWFVHRYIMHVKRPFPLADAFRGHTLVHHQLYKWDSTFEASGPGRPKNVALRWYAFPVMILCHVPVFWMIQNAIHAPVMWPMLAACTLYFTGYEYTHYLMHVPKGHYIERYAWFRFTKEHHRLHHKYMLRNLNVFIPLADLCLGTLVTSEGWRSKPARRQRFLVSRRRGALVNKSEAKTNSG
ncbi:MAG: hypothetical protein ACLQVD_04530 [Capsulimonadaceae bacterium]